MMGRWVIDPDHSCAAFTVRHMMVTNVHGQFNRVAGTISFDQADVSSSSVEVAIDVSGVYTGIRKRDDHLRSADFLDVATYPNILFRSTSVEPAGQNRILVTGDLTMRGATRPVTFEAEYRGPEKSPYGGEITLGFTAVTAMNREDFGIVWNEPLESGGVMVGKEVGITLDVEADLAE